MNDKTPRIRFKGFTDDWEQRKLKEILIQRTEHQKISDDAPLLAFSYAEGVISPEDKKSNKRDFIMTDKYNKIFSRTELNDIIYNPANVVHGAIHRNKLGTGVVSPIYKIFMCNGVSPKFIGERLHTDKFILEVTKFIEGTVVKLRTLSPEMFLEMSIEIPKSYEEQDRIGTYFTNLDNLITLHQRKCEVLVNIKKSMLEKMFPKNGKKVPEIRFEGFTDDWEQRKFGDVVQITMGQSPDGSTYSDEPSDYILVQGNADLQNGWVCPRVWTTQITKKADAGDLIMSVRAPAGAMGKTAYNAVIGRGVAAIKGNEFIYQLLIKMDKEGYWKKDSTGSTFESLNSSSIKNAEIKLPTLEEQNKIGEYFLNLDNLITLHQRKLEKLQNIKKSMLEQMLI